MALPYGGWTANVNGAETILHIDPPDAHGIFTGQIFGGRIRAFGMKPHRRFSSRATRKKAVVPRVRCLGSLRDTSSELP